MAIQFDDLSTPRLPTPRAIGITVAIIMAVFVLGALAFSLVQQRVWGAEADILFSPGSDMSDAAVERAFATQQVILRSPTVLQPVATATGIPVRDLAESLSIEIVERSNVVRLTVANRDRATAVKVAQMIADEYRRGFTSAGSNSPQRQIGQPQFEATILTRAHPLERPLEPQPLRALAAGLIAGLVISAAAVAVMLWPRFATDRFSWE